MSALRTLFLRCVFLSRKPRPPTRAPWHSPRHREHEDSAGRISAGQQHSRTLQIVDTEAELARPPARRGDGPLRSDAS